MVVCYNEIYKRDKIMCILSRDASRFVVFSLIGVFALMSFAFPDDATARDRSRGKVRSYQGERSDRHSPPRREVRSSSRRRVVRSPHVYKRGHVIPRLPRGYRRAWHNHSPYYYYGGVFYRPGLSGFVVVNPPVGMVVLSLPIGYRRVWVDDGWYYVYGDVFYRSAPGGYVVVEAPRTVIVEEPPVILQPPELDSGEVSVIVSVLNVRAGPGLDYPVLYQIHQDYILEVHGKTTGWLYVELPNGEFGWVMNIYTRRIEPPGSG